MLARSFCSRARRLNAFSENHSRDREKATPVNAVVASSAEPSEVVCVEPEQVLGLSMADSIQSQHSVPTRQRRFGKTSAGQYRSTVPLSLVKGHFEELSEQLGWPLVRQAKVLASNPNSLVRAHSA